MAKETYVDKLKMQIGVASAKVRADNYFPLIGDTVTMNAETRWGQTSGWQLDTGTGTTNEDGNLTNQKDSHQVTVANDGELQQKFTVENYLTEAEVFKTLYAMQPQALPYFDIETTEVARVGDTFTLKTVPENGYALACTGVCRIYKENETESPAKTLTLSPGTGTSVLETSVSFSEASERGIYDVEVDVTDTASGVTLSKRVNKLITVVPKLCPKPADTSTGYEVASTYKAQTSYSEGKSLDFPIKLWRNVDGSGLNYAELILPRGDEENSRWDIEADISALPAGTTLCLKKDPNEPESYPFRFFPSGNSNHNNTNENGTKNFTYAEPLVVTHDCEDVFEWTWRSYGAVNVGWNSHNVILDGYGYHNTGIHFKVFDTRLSYDSCFFLCNGTSDWEMFGCDIDGAGFAGILAKSDPNPNNPWYWRDNGYEFKNLRIHHCIIQNTGGEGVYLGYYNSGKLSGYNSAGSPVEYYAHLMRDTRLYRCRFYRTGLDSVQINNGVGVEVCYCDIQEPAINRTAQQEYGFSCTFDGKVYNCNITGCNGTAMLIGPLMDGIKIFNNVIEAARFKGVFQYALWTSSKDEHADPDGDGEVDLAYEIYNNVIKGYNLGSFNSDYDLTPLFKMCDNVIITEKGDTSVPSLFTGEGNKFVKAWFEYDSIDSQLKVADSANSDYQIAHNSPLVTSGEAGMAPFDMRGYKNWYKTICHCGPFMGKYKDGSVVDENITIDPSKVYLSKEGSPMMVEVTSSSPWAIEADTVQWDSGEGAIYLEYDGQTNGTITITSDPNTLDTQRTKIIRLTTTGSGNNATADLTIIQMGDEPDYITIDQTDGDNITVSGDVNGEEIKWIRQNSHRYLGKNTAEGVMKICRLNDLNGNEFHDGTTASLKGTDCDVFMKLPRFYYHAEEISDNVWKIGFLKYKLGETWKEWDGNDLIGVYRAYYDGVKIRSISGTDVTGNLPFETFESYVNARGKGYSMLKWKHHCMLGVLYFSMYGNVDSLSTLGSAPSWNVKNGNSDTLGMTDTKKEDGSNCVNFWGLENFFACAIEFMGNVSVKERVKMTVTEDDGSKRELVPATTYNGKIRKLSFGEYLDLVPIETGGSGNGYFSEFLQNSNSGEVAMHSNFNAGIYWLDLTRKRTDVLNKTVTRLAFRGEIEEIEDVETFKSLEEI